MIEAWKNWQHWWFVDSEANTIHDDHGELSNFVNNINAFNIDGYLDNNEFINLQRKLDQLYKLGESDGKLKLINLMEKSNNLQLINEQQKKNFVTFMILSSSQQQQQQHQPSSSSSSSSSITITSIQQRQLPLNLSILFIQKLIRLANHQYSLIFNDHLPLIIDYLNHKIDLINKFLDEFQQFSNILNDNEIKLKKFETFLLLCNYNHQMNNLKENSYQQLQLLNIDFNEITLNYIQLKFSSDISVILSIQWNESIFIDFLNQFSINVKLLMKLIQVS